MFPMMQEDGGDKEMVRQEEGGDEEMVGQEEGSDEEQHMEVEQEIDEHETGGLSFESRETGASS